MERLQETVNIIGSFMDHKTSNMVPRIWIQKCMEVFGVAVHIRLFVNVSMNQWNTELSAGNQRVGSMKIKCEVFQDDSLFPLLFVLVMIPLILVLRQTKAAYEVKKGGKKINHLLFMDDLKLLLKNEDQMYIMVKTVRIFSEDIKMELWLERWNLKNQIGRQES